MTPDPTRSDRPERLSNQPLAKMNKDEAIDRKPDPELGKHGPLAGETADRPDGKRQG
jgi:hypothetical protein